jgi:hypothetical protein
MNVQTNTFWVLAKFVKTKSNMNQIESRSVVFRSRSRTLGSSWKVEFGLERMPPQLGSSRAAKRCRVQSHRRHTKPRWKSHVIRLCGCGKMRSTSSSMQTCHHSRYWLVGFTDWHRHWVSPNAHQIVLHAPRNLRSVDSASVTLWFRSICNTLPISRVSRRSLSKLISAFEARLSQCDSTVSHCVALRHCHCSPVAVGWSFWISCRSVFVNHVTTTSTMQSKERINCTVYIAT